MKVNMHTCNKCQEFGLQFTRNYKPHEFFEGNRKARIWIVGLNPALNPNWQDLRSAEELLICNGRDVCAEVKRLLPPQEGTAADATHYVYQRKSQNITIVLSGFIGRIDNHAKRRLGQEIEALLSIVIKR